MQHAPNLLSTVMMIYADELLVTMFSLVGRRESKRGRERVKENWRETKTERERKETKEVK